VEKLKQDHLSGKTKQGYQYTQQLSQAGENYINLLEKMPKAPAAMAK
jgi:hypothetical protein